MDKDALIAAGIDYDQGVERFAGRQELYEHYLVEFFGSDEMNHLLEQLRAKDYDAAFGTAHDLKGTSGNLSVNNLYVAICKLVEALRNGADTGAAMSLYNQAEEIYQRVKCVVRGE